MKKWLMFVVGSNLSLVMLLGCGGNSPPSATAAAPVAVEPADRLPAFASLATKEAKIERMKKVVMPNVGKVFVAHDSAKYGGDKYSCKTCHGPNWAAPQAFLPKLKLSGDGFQKLAAEKPQVVKWMSEVEPVMAAAMGEAPYDMKTNAGFGCHGCHAVD